MCDNRYLSSEEGWHIPWLVLQGLIDVEHACGAMGYPQLCRK